MAPVQTLSGRGSKMREIGLWSVVIGLIGTFLAAMFQGWAFLIFFASVFNLGVVMILMGVLEDRLIEIRDAIKAKG